jgi:hypothetical protein
MASVTAVQVGDGDTSDFLIEAIDATGVLFLECDNASSGRGVGSGDFAGMVTTQHRFTQL